METVATILTVYLALGCLWLLLPALVARYGDGKGWGEVFDNFGAPVVLGALFMGGVVCLTMNKTAERFEEFNDTWFDEYQPCWFSSRIARWAGLMAIYTGSIVLLGTAAMQSTRMRSHLQLERPQSRKVKEAVMTGLLLPIVVVGSLGFTTYVVLHASAEGDLKVRGGLNFESWATLLFGGGLWCLTQACAVAIFRQSCRFSATAFAAAVVPALLPLISDAFDSAKDICFMSLALQNPDESVQAIGWASGALILSVHLCMLATEGGRFELKGTYLSVLAAAGNAHSADAEEGTLDKLGLMLVKQTNPDRLRFLIIEDAPQAILASVFSVASSTVNPVVVSLNIAFPIVRILVAKLLYARLFSWGFIVKALVQPLFQDLPDSTRSWVMNHLEAGMKMQSPATIGRLLIQSQVQATGKDAKTVFFELLLPTMWPEAARKGWFEKDRKEFAGEVNEPMQIALVECFLQANTKFESFDLKCDAATAIELIKANVSSESCILKITDIGNGKVAALADALKANTVLQSLDLKSNSIGSEGGVALADALKANKTLQYLNLEDNCIGVEGAIALADALKANKMLQALDLEDNIIDVEGAIALADALKANKTLQFLNLMRNSFFAEGAIALADALKANNMLQSLNLESNRIGVKGAIALADALKANKMLHSLNLESNMIGDEGAIALADALKANKLLQSLNLGDNSIGVEGAIALADALKANKTLQFLNLDVSSIGDEGAIALADALKAHPSLETLDISLNDIGDEGAIAFANLLKGAESPKVLRLLNLQDNDFGPCSEEALQEAEQSLRKQGRPDFEFSLWS